MSNPLTALKKLGIRLVGDNGLLDTAAAAHYGLGPLAKQKMIDEARKTALTEATSIQDLEAGNLDMEGKRIDNTGKLQTQSQSQQLFPHELKQKEVNANKGQLELDDARLDAELRTKTKAQLAKILNVDEEEAEAYLNALGGINKSGNMIIDEEMGKKYDMKPGITDDRVVNLRAQDKRNEFQQIAEEGRERRRLAADANRNKSLEDKAFEEATNEAHRIKSSKQYQENVTALSKIEQMNDGLRELQMGRVLKGAVTPVLIMSFNKVLDPISVVRSEEYARTAEEQSLIRRVQGYKSSISEGSKIDQKTLEEITYVANLIAKRAKEKQKEMLDNFKGAMKLRPLTSILPDAYLDRVMNVSPTGNDSKSNAIVDSILGTN